MAWNLGTLWRLTPLVLAAWALALAPLADAGVAGRVAPAAAASGAIVVKAQPASVAVPAGGEAAVDLVAVAGDQTLDTLMTVVSYPPDLLDVVRVDPGPALRVTLRNQLDSARGEVRFGAGREVSQPAPSGTFTLATLRFRGRTAGTALVRLAGPTEAAFAGDLLTVTTEDGVITVTPASGGSSGGRSSGGGGSGSSAAPATPPDAGLVNTASGGSVTYDGVTVTVPPGAVSASTQLRVHIARSALPAPARPPDGALTGSTAFSVGLTDAGGAAVTHLSQHLQLAVSYLESDVRRAGDDPGRLRLYRYDAAADFWHDLQAVAATGSRTLHASTSAAGLFALVVDLAMPTPLGPPSGETHGLGTTLTWTSPPHTAQFQVQVVPFNQDGPAINLIIGQAGLVQAARFEVLPPVMGSGPYIVLPGMSYVWRVRVSPLTEALGEEDPGWSRYAGGEFRTPPPVSSTITPVEPAPDSAAASLTPTLRWANASNDIFYYEVQLSADPAFVTDPLAATAAVYWNLVHGGNTGPLNSWTAPPGFPLEPETVYFWRVRPRVQGDGLQVAWSATWSFRTP